MKKTIHILVGSTNVHKIEEIGNIIGDMPVTFSSPASYDDRITPDIVEDAATFKGNAVIKAAGFARWYDTMALADDSGLEVRALGNSPGVHSARYAGEGASNDMRIQKLLSAMSSVPDGKRVARFKCAVALADPNGKTLFVVEAKCNGIITHEPRGNKGFGYDSVFYLPEMGMTFAEMEPADKNKVSHRSRALALFKEQLQSLFD